jgi:hypothetical protein
MYANQMSFHSKFTVVAVMEMYFVGFAMGVSDGKITSGV